VDFANPLRVLTPTLDAEVLRVLAPADKAFTGREIHRRTNGASQEGVRVALGRLVRQGIVEDERAGNATLFRLNRDHLAAAHIVALASLRQRFFDRLREELAAGTISPAAAAVFGSVARGDADEDSDIDLLIVRPPQAARDEEQWSSQLFALQVKASAWTGNDARVVEYASDEFRRLRTHEPLIRDAIREGIVIHGAWSAVE
jgi:predicted nucleotidyltransferase